MQPMLTCRESAAEKPSDIDNKKESHRSDDAQNAGVFERAIDTNNLCIARLNPGLDRSGKRKEIGAVYEFSPRNDGYTDHQETNASMNFGQIPGYRKNSHRV